MTSPPLVCLSEKTNGKNHLSSLQYGIPTPTTTSVIWDLRDKENPRKVFDHSLPWFLALCGERQGKGWDAQEYLDRQDHYILTFYVPDKRDYTLDAKVKVNGWVLNLQNTDLGGDNKE